MNETPLQVASRNLLRHGVVIVPLVVVIATAIWLSWYPTPLKLLDRAQTLLRSDPTRSERLARQALDMEGTHRADAAITLCRVLARRMARDEMASILATIELDRCRPDLLLTFGRDMLFEGNRTAAHAVLESLGLRGVPESLTALELLRSDYQEWGQQEQQLATTRQLTRLEPENPQRWANLIQLLIGMSQDAECVAVIREAQHHELPLELHGEFQNYLVQRLINLGDIPAIRRELTELRKKEGDSARVLSHQTYLFRMEGKLELALKTISRLMGDRAAAPPFAYFTRGIVYLDLRRFKEAAKDLEQTLAAEPFNSAATFKLSEAYRGMGQDNLAKQFRDNATGIVAKQKRISALLKQRQHEPRNVKIYEELEQLHRDLGETEAARKWRQWSLRVEKSD